MTIRKLTDTDKQAYNRIVSNVMQSWEWGEFREKVGMDVVRVGVFDKNQFVLGFQINFHKIPKTNFTDGYIPKSEIPPREILEELVKIGRQHNCLYIKLEPDVEKNTQNKKLFEEFLSFPGLVVSSKPIFAKNTFLLDLTPTEEELLATMHPKTRYNIRLAARHGVVVEEKNDLEALETFITLQKETARRQGFFVYKDSYYRKVWETLAPQGMAHLVCASYRNKVLAVYFLFQFQKTLYYTYGASSQEHKEVMAANLLMWECIKLGKKWGLQAFDMWGALDKNADPADPWYGFHRFKEGYGGKLTEYLGSYDLVLNHWPYKLFILLDKLRWFFKRLRPRN